MNNAVLEKIKALLRLARSPNPHEAALALQRAMEIAAKHAVDVESLDLDAETEQLTHEWFECGLRRTFLDKRCLDVVARFFNVGICMGRRRTVFVGKPTDIGIAHYVYEFIVGAGRRWIRDWEKDEKKARRKVNAVKRRNFTLGFIYGISSQLREQKEKFQVTDGQKAIVIADQQARDRYLDELIPSAHVPKLDDTTKNQTSLMKGWRAGLSTQINKPLQSSGGQTLALEGPRR